MENLNYTTKSRELYKKVKALEISQVPDDQAENISHRLKNKNESKNVFMN